MATAMRSKEEIKQAFEPELLELLLEVLLDIRELLQGIDTRIDEIQGR